MYSKTAFTKILETCRKEERKEAAQEWKATERLAESIQWDLKSCRKSECPLSVAHIFRETTNSKVARAATSLGKWA
jgi:hypothetical protein